jgi:L-ribulose-5-phosphate 3-epimerase
MSILDRLAATTTCFLPYPLDDALEGIAAAGYRRVELASIRGVCEHVPPDANTAVLESVCRRLDRHSLTPDVLSAHSDLTSARGLVDARRALEVCHAMGVPILNTAVGGAEAHDGPEDEAAFLANIGGLADRAGELGVTITLEIHGDLTATGERSARLMEKVNRPNVRINYDTANCEYYGGVRAEDDLRYALPWLGLCHLKDTTGGRKVWDFPALGEGRVDFRAVLADLGRSGYAGPLCVEVEFRGHPWPPAATVREALKASHDFLAGLDRAPKPG